MGVTPITLGLVFAPTHQFSVPIPGGPAFISLPLALQGIAIDFSAFQGSMSNALDAVIGDC